MFAVMSARSFAPFKRLRLFNNMWLVMGILASILIQLLVVYTPFLQNVFGTTYLGFREWIVILGISCFGFILMELSKFFVKEKYSVKVPSELAVPKI
jgi:Ca2+-transporting ATPase